MIIVLLSLAMVLAFAGTAYAATTGNNETNTWNPPGPTYTYPGAPAAGLRGGSAFALGDPSPHEGYSVTSNKCEVCHSPHKAGDVAGGTSYKLLYGTTSATGATGSCTVCHVSGSLSIVNVYNASTGVMAGGHDLAAMTGGVPDTTWATADASLGCSDCHTVHGAGAIDFDSGPGVLKTFILRSLPTWNGVTHSGATPAVDETQFCTGCHDMNYDDAANGITHYMGAPDGADSTGGASRQVASASSADCDSCHHAPKSTGTVVTVAKWPHQSVSIVGLGHGQDGHDVTSQAEMDDHCLNCHSAIGTSY
jgi:hypothetical protein